MTKKRKQFHLEKTGYFVDFEIPCELTNVDTIIRCLQLQLEKELKDLDMAEEDRINTPEGYGYSTSDYLYLMDKAHNVEFIKCAMEFIQSKYPPF